jgi:hypothetical protein
MTDKNGYELSIGDPVRCDDQPGRVVGFEGMGILVEMDEDKARVDWPSEQVEYAS